MQNIEQNQGASTSKRPKKLRKGWRFINAEEQSRNHPQTFHIPDLQDRLAVQAGSSVKVGLMSKLGGGERFWLRVVSTAMQGSELIAIGEVDNSIILVDWLDYGDRLQFSREHIIDIHPTESQLPLAF